MLESTHNDKSSEKRDRVGIEYVQQCCIPHKHTISRTTRPFDSRSHRHAQPPWLLPVEPSCRSADRARASPCKPHPANALPVPEPQARTEDLLSSVRPPSIPPLHRVCPSVRPSVRRCRLASSKRPPSQRPARFYLSAGDPPFPNRNSRETPTSSPAAGGGHLRGI